MGAAARMAERTGKTHCDGCGKSWSEVRIASFGGGALPFFGVGPPTPWRALCGDCDYLESMRRYEKDRPARGSKSRAR